MSENINRKLTAEDFQFVQVDEKIYDQKFEGKPIGFFMDAWLRFKQNKASVLAAIIIVFIVLMAIFAPMFARYGYREMHTSFGMLPPRIPVLEDYGIFDGSKVIEIQKSKLSAYEEKGAVMEILEEYTWNYRKKEIPMVRLKVSQYVLRDAGDHYFWFGTDNVGRDLWVRMWRGARISLLIGFCSVIINCFIGVVYGSISGYYGGKVDMFMQRVIEVLDGVPFQVMAILFVLFLGAGVTSFILVMVITGWIGMSRMIRAQFYRYKDYEYVLASRTMGAKDRTLIFRHILPNAIGPIITQAHLRRKLPSADLIIEDRRDGVGHKLDHDDRKIGIFVQTERFRGKIPCRQNGEEHHKNQHRREHRRFGFDSFRQNYAFPGCVFFGSFVTRTPFSVSRISTDTSKRPRGTSFRM